ncbi:hypothetical protein AB0E27_40185 [Streptomyces sparsogenes]|uniref:hypothetical protein n=1 Tax=Streptomyces sparsogenes TaxID=67365 RepID=UPI0034112579
MPAVPAGVVKQIERAGLQLTQRDVLPHTPEDKPGHGMFRLGGSPGMAKHQGTQNVLRAHRSAPACSFSGPADNSDSRLTADSLLVTRPGDQLRLLH